MLPGPPPLVALATYAKFPLGSSTIAVGILFAATGAAVLICVSTPVFKLIPYEFTSVAPWLMTSRSPAGRDEPPQPLPKQLNPITARNPITPPNLIDIL